MRSESSTWTIKNVYVRKKFVYCEINWNLLADFYKEKIPSDSPPSYRGQLVKYSYKITIGTQKVSSPVKLLYVPIRVLPLCEEFFNEGVGLCNDTTEELTPANPFLEIRQKESPLDLALQSLQVCSF